MKFERYSDKVLEEIHQDLEASYIFLQGFLVVNEALINRFEGILFSDFGITLRKLREQNPDLTEEFRLKAVAEVECLIEEIETEIEMRFLNRN